jgi:hypothetical protein
MSALPPESGQIADILAVAGLSADQQEMVAAGNTLKLLGVA